MKNRFNGQTEKTSAKKATATKDHTQNSHFEKPEVTYTQLQYDLGKFMRDQVDAFLLAQTQKENMDNNQWRNVVRALFSLDTYPYILPFAPDCNAYMVNRSVRTDRETYLLKRASCTMVLINIETGAPVCLVEAFINDNGGVISIIPQTEKGADLRNTYRISIKRD